MKIPSISVVFNFRNKKNKKRLYSIYLRITLNRRSKYVRIPTPLKVSEGDWNYKNNGGNYVKNTNPFAFEINNSIKEFETIAYDTIKKHLATNRRIKIESIIEGLKNKNIEVLYNTFVEDYIKHPKENFKLATITKYRTFLKHLNNFNSEIYFKDLTPELVDNFRKYLEVDLGLKGNTIKSYFDKFKKTVFLAEKEGFLDYTQTRFLFDDVKIKPVKPKRIYLEVEEIKRLAALKFSKEEDHLKRTRDFFLFQVYTGFYYKDLKILKKENVKLQKGVGKYIIGKRDKNGNTAIIPIYKFKNIDSILELYKSEPDDEDLFNKEYFIEDQVYNRQLKEIAQKARIKKNISNRVGRHTNVQLWIRYGAERPIISKMVGHAKEATTKEYYDVYALDVFEGTKNVDFEKLGI